MYIYVRPRKPCVFKQNSKVVRTERVLFFVRIKFLFLNVKMGITTSAQFCRLPTSVQVRDVSAVDNVPPQLEVGYAAPAFRAGERPPPGRARPPSPREVRTRWHLRT